MTMKKKLLFSLPSQIRARVLSNYTEKHHSDSMNFGSYATMLRPFFSRDKKRSHESNVDANNYAQQLCSRQPFLWP